MIVPLIVEVDSNNPKKNIDKLDISIPILNTVLIETIGTLMTLI